MPLLTDDRLLTGVDWSRTPDYTTYSFYFWDEIADVRGDVYGVLPDLTLTLIDGVWQLSSSAHRSLIARG